MEPFIFRRLIAGELLLFLMAALIVFLIQPVHGLTVSPPRFNESIKPGDTAVFDVLITNSTPEEIAIERPTVAGECSAMIAIESAGGNLPQTVRTRITVPPGAENRSYRCDMTITPNITTTQIRYSVEIPYTLRIIGGIEPVATVTTTPTTTTTTEPTTTTTTPKHTPKPTGTPKPTYAPIPAILLPAALVIAAWRRRA